MENHSNGHSAKKIAVYWDFENIHNGIQPPGMQSLSRPSSRMQEEMVNVNVVMDYLSSLGNVVINRAYANWTQFKNYRFILLEHSVDLVQLFPRGPHAKNGADIRMAIDAIEDKFYHADLDIQVVIGGDSDFSGLAQKLRMHGNYVIGIGAKNSSNIYWIKSCNEFKYYHSLMPRDAAHERAEHDEASPDSKPRAEANIDDAKDLLLRAVRRLSKSREDGRVPLYGIRPMMIRIEPSFDESSYGHANFAKFVESCRDVVRIEGVEDEQVVVPMETSVNVSFVNSGPMSADDLGAIYRNTLRQINYRLMPAPERLTSLSALYDILIERGPIEDAAALKEMLIDRYSEQGQSLTDQDAQSIWDMGYKANAYYFQEYPYRMIVVNERVQTKAALIRRADQSIIKRLLGKCPVQPLKADALAKLLYGDEPDKEGYMTELIGEALTLM